MTFLENKTWKELLALAFFWTAVLFAVLLMTAGGFFLATLVIFLLFGEISALAAFIWAVISVFGTLLLLAAVVRPVVNVTVRKEDHKA